MNRNLTKKIGKITVKKFEWGNDTDLVEQYIVADSIAISNQQIKEHKLDLIKEILYPNGDIAYKIVKTNPKSK